MDVSRENTKSSSYPTLNKCIKCYTAYTKTFVKVTDCKIFMAVSMKKFLFFKLKKFALRQNLKVFLNIKEHTIVACSLQYNHFQT